MIPSKQKEDATVNKWLYRILILILVAVFLFSGWKIAAYYLEGMNNQGRFDDLTQQMEDAKNQTNPPVYYVPPTEPPTLPPTEPNVPTEDPTEPPATEPTESTEPTAPVILSEYAPLYLENPDLVGWIQIEGTVINYPVMQTPDDPDYYLKRDFDGDYSDWGCIYVEEFCDVFTPSDNVTIYGHHMYDGSMFTALTRYTSKSFLEAHPYIIFNTLLERHTYEIIAVFTTTASVGEGFRYNAFVNADNEEEFDDYIWECKRLSLYRIGATAEYGDKLITLSTCEYSQVNGRLVVVAKRIAEVPAETPAE